MSVKFSISFRKPTPSKSDALYENAFILRGNNDHTVLLIHGLTGTPNEMRFIANALNKKGFSVNCPRLAKHGEPVEILKYAKWQEFYESSRRAFGEICSSGSGGKIFVSGLSMGALLGLLLADEFNGKVAGVSCLSPTLFYDGWNTPWTKCLLPLGYYTPLKYLYYYKEEPPYGIKNEAMRKVVHRYYSRADLRDAGGVAQYGYPYIPISMLYQLRLLVKHLAKRLPNIRVPVQLIQAQDDDMTSVKNSQFIYDRIMSEKKEIVLLHNSYHVITADQERDKVAGKVSEFFNRIAASAS
jgi:carboxylesterase